ncbi:helix-turn-helix domain-containing protein [Beduinella massiliensis]|uniref:helix-turn-helix domain-containing protein n=1 Tax=Beduinella massiliensis TaxID=1852363 RepID=UPI000C822DF8
MRNLKKLRKERRLTQIAIKIETGIDQSLLSKYEHGERIPSTNDLIVLADFFKTNIDYLLDRTDVSDPLPPKKANDESEKE